MPVRNLARVAAAGLLAICVVAPAAALPNPSKPPYLAVYNHAQVPLIVSVDAGPGRKVMVGSAERFPITLGAHRVRFEFRGKPPVDKSYTVADWYFVGETGTARYWCLDAGPAGVNMIPVESQCTQVAKMTGASA